MLDQLGAGDASEMPDVIALLDDADLYDVANKSVVTTQYNRKSGKIAKLTGDLKKRNKEISGKVGDTANDNLGLAKKIRDEAGRLGLVLRAAGLVVSVRSLKPTPIEEKSILTEVVSTILHVEKEFAAVVGNNSERAGNMGPLTLEQLEKIFPETAQGTLRKYLPYLNQAMRDHGIETPKRVAAFLAQIGVETDDLKTLTEYGDAAYFNRNYGPHSSVGPTLGNSRSGDGARFRGRGAMQLTGRNNYRAAGEALEVDFVGKPELAADPKYAFATAAWYWDSRNLNDLADESDIGAITRAVNGGDNGSSERNENYRRARKVLDAE
ncbi:glycoside hydrolase family 19 protein [Nocardia pneumoniae]|uniref:glycoside hydrolase family 19 protein n=1 Tax=Nocardia pneumoniae TaxID=228601 RepID=UPI001C3F435F|nr:glycoside hydrolase family 19 protein [Nocardia pneumoniae]